MQLHRNGETVSASSRNAAPPPPVDRVCGLGLCDVLRVELEACQVDSFADEIDELRRVLDEAIVMGTTADDSDELGRLRYDRDVIEMIARELRGDRDDHDRLIVCGPARLMSELIGGAARDAAERLVDQLAARPVDSADLITAATVAMAWTRTYAAKEAVESYSFDPELDPLR